MSSDAIGQICALLTAVTWAISMVLFKRCGESMPPMALNLFKNTIGLTLLGLTVMLVGEPVEELTRQRPRDIAILLFSGFLGIAVADTVFLKALNMVGVGIQSIVDCLYSPLVMLFAWVWIGERMAPMDYLGAGLVIFGVFLATRHRRRPDGPQGAPLLAGILVGASAIAMIAVAIVIAKPILGRFPLYWATLLRLGAGTAPLLLWACVDRKTLAVFRPRKMWNYAVPGAILGAYVSMILWIAGFKYTDAGAASVLNQTSTLFAILLASLVLKEQLSPRKLAAMCCAMIGVVIVTVY